VQALGHLLQQRARKLLIGRIFREVNGNQDLLSLGINIANINTTLVGEENPIALSGGRQLGSDNQEEKKGAPRQAAECARVMLFHRRTLAHSEKRFSLRSSVGCLHHPHLT